MAAPLGAQSGEAVTVPPGLAARVARALADRWSVPVEAIRLSWGVARMADQLSDSVDFQLVGAGRSGRMALGVVTDDRRFSIGFRAGMVDTVAVAARFLERGAVLQESDIRLVEATAWGVPRPGEPLPGPGWVVRRAVAEGDRLRHPAVSPPVLVRPGETVRLVWSSGGVRVVVEGRASGSGSLGDAVAVRIPGRTGRLQGIITGPGTARLGT